MSLSGLQNSGDLTPRGGDLCGAAVPSKTSCLGAAAWEELEFSGVRGRCCGHADTFAQAPERRAQRGGTLFRN